jgi:hypothetical protein
MSRSRRTRELVSVADATYQATHTSWPGGFSIVLMWSILRTGPVAAHMNSGAEGFRFNKFCTLCVLTSKPDSSYGRFP